MIGEAQNQNNASVNKGLIVLRDAIVTFIIVLLAGLQKAGYPPNPETVYFAFLTGLGMGVVSYMHALGIKQPEQTTITPP